MKRSTTFLVVIAVIIGAITFYAKVSAANGPVAEDQAAVRPEGRAWSSKMQELYKTLVDVLTDVTSDKRFKDPANKYRITNEANRLAVLVHDLTKRKMVSADKDPTLPFVAGLLEEDTKMAALALKKGNRSYARSILRTIPSYCITCHTRNDSGVQFAELPLEPSSKSLTPVERGEFFAATRQFDRAQQEFISVIRDSRTANRYPLDWLKGVRDSLNIAVRVKQDPAQASDIVLAVLDTPGAPAFVKQDAKVWKNSIEDWKNEAPRELKTEDGLHAEALRLMNDAREVQKYPMDRTADILYLRASAVLHQLMQTAPNGNYINEALLLAGVSYEVLNPIESGDLQDLYYEACIRKSPHSEIAQLCYQRYEQSIYFGYTGSAGTDIPDEAISHMIELKTLSQPEKSTLIQ